MSYYGNDENDSTRSAGGQYHNHPFADLDQQKEAGVKEGDSFGVSLGKVDNHRRNHNLDPLTGEKRTTFFLKDPEGDPSQILQVLGSLIKKILWTTAIVISIGGVGVGALVAGRSMDGPTLAARAGQGEFASYQPAPLSKYFPENDLATPVDPAAFVAAVHAVKPGKGEEDMKRRARPIQGIAYRCMRQPGCRDVVAKLDPKLGAVLPRAASSFFFDLAKAGNEDAIRDICLFAAKFGTSYKDLLIAHSFCSQANYERKNSKAGVEAHSMLENSWAYRRARIYDWADEFQYRLKHPSH